MLRAKLARNLTAATPLLSKWQRHYTFNTIIKFLNIEFYHAFNLYTLYQCKFVLTDRQLLALHTFATSTDLLLSVSSLNILTASASFSRRAALAAVLTDE